MQEVEQPSQIRPVNQLEAIVAKLLQNHYNQIYKELQAYEQALTQRLQPNPEETKD